MHLLGLARRAGQVVTGYEKVRARVRESVGGRPPAALFAARDSAVDGRTRIAALAAAVLEPGLNAASTGGAGAGRKGPGCRLIVGFDAAELGQPLGKERAVHVALDRGRLAQGILEACDLLAGFRSGPMVVSVSDALTAAGKARSETAEDTAPQPSDETNGADDRAIR